MASVESFTAVSWTGCALAIVTVIARLFTRIVLLHHVGLDDFFMVLALICSIATAAMGQVITDAPSNGANPAKIGFLIGLPVILGQFFGRTSFALTLLELMGTTRIRRRFLYFIIASQFVVNFVSLNLTYSICKPLSVFWDPTDAAKSASCLALYEKVVVNSWQYFGTVWDALSDFALALFPGLIIRSLQMNRRTKVGVIILMGLGVFAGLAAIIKSVVFGLQYTDKYNAEDLAIWTVLQEYIIVMTASASSCRPLFRSRKQRGVGQPGSYEIGPLSSSTRLFLSRRNARNTADTSAPTVVERGGYPASSKLEAALQSMDRDQHGSTEYILSPEEHVSQGGIKKTTEWNVQHDGVFETARASGDTIV